MKLIIGLGNPGRKYQETRHNLGWQTLDELAQKLDINTWETKTELKSSIAAGFSNQKKIILAKPQTFMNGSGQAVKLLLKYYKVPLDSLLIIQDELDLPLGEIKLQKNRGPAGHHGLESIIKHLKTKDFGRVRIGIKPQDISQTEKSEEFVLQKFNPAEKPLVQEAIKKAVAMIAEKLLLRCCFKTWKSRTKPKN